MLLNLLRLGFAAVWLAVAVVMFAAGSCFNDRPVPFADLTGLAALALALWNVARWWQARTRPAAVWRRRPRPVGDEYHPEFDFGGQPDGRPPG